MPRRPRTKAAHYETRSLEDHAALIAQQVEASLRDGETRKLAAKLASGRHAIVQGQPVVEYHGHYYPVKPRACAHGDDRCPVINVWNFLVMNVRYTPDMHAIDTYQDLRTTLEIGAGDCDDFTIAFGALLHAIGYYCCQKIISVDGQTWAHVYPMVNVPGGGWLALDATERGKPIGWEYPAAKAQVAYPLTLESS